MDSSVVGWRAKFREEQAACKLASRVAESDVLGIYDQ